MVVQRRSQLDRGWLHYQTPLSTEMQRPLGLHTRGFAENLVAFGLLRSASYIKPIPTHEKLFAVGKSGPIATFNLIFLGFGWPWVAEFVGFMAIFICFQTQQNLVNRKHLTIVTARMDENVTVVWSSYLHSNGPYVSVESGTRESSR